MLLLRSTVLLTKQHSGKQREADTRSGGSALQTVAGWSSLAARRAHNPKVTGSNPVPATSSLKIGQPIGVGSWSGRRFAKVDCRRDEVTRTELEAVDLEESGLMAKEVEREQEDLN
jgi:hypothetical protein